ncbi:MAG: asparaginase [Deltaproteobacteria bacterium]|nr:asparaginase [Deltaproteobacteria bacterium]
MLHTGGTLAMEGKRPQPLYPADFEHTLREQVPELARIALIEFEVFSNIDSSDMRPMLWSKLAERIHVRLPEVDGVVVTHGTDTMAWTASALSFMLRGLRKPVVLTGSQRPLGEVRTDARLNLIDAVTAATTGPSEVCICFDSRLYRGNRSRKIKINDYDAFESPNFPPLGTLGVDIVYGEARRPKGPPRVMPRLEPHVFLLGIFPGIPPRVARAILPGLRGLVIQGFGAGNFPVEGEASLLPLFDEARERGIPTVMVSQARCNAVDLSLYEAGAAALQRGVISGGDMTPETALVKLMHVLGYEKDPARVRALLEADLVGERTTA